MHAGRPKLTLVWERNPPGVPLSGKTYRPSLPANRGPAVAARVAGRKIREAFCPPAGACSRRVPAIRTGATAARRTPRAGAAPKNHAIYDAQGRRYEYRVQAIPLDRVVTSHTTSGAADPRAFPDFQARTFSIRRADEIGKALDPDRLAPEGSTPTIGAPVVWLDAKTGLYHTLAGNHRMVGMRLSGKLGKTVALRVLAGSFADAKRFAAASQRSDAAPETLVERARADVRSLGLTLDDLPRQLGAEPITRDNVAAFLAENRRFAEKVLRPGEEVSPEDSAARVNAALVGLLPAGAQEVLAVVGSKAEQAIAAGAPILLHLHREALGGRVLPVFDLFESFDRAARLFRRFAGKGKTASKIVDELERSALTPTLGGFDQELAREVDAGDVGLVLGLVSLERRANPAEGMAEAFAALLKLARENDPRQARLFGGGPDVDRLDVVRVLFGPAIAKMAAKFDPARTSKNPGRPRKAHRRRGRCRCGTIVCNPEPTVAETNARAARALASVPAAARPLLAYGHERERVTDESMTAWHPHPRVAERAWKFLRDAAAAGDPLVLHVSDGYGFSSPAGSLTLRAPAFRGRPWKATYTSQTERVWRNPDAFRSAIEARIADPENRRRSGAILERARSERAQPEGAAPRAPRRTGAPERALPRATTSRPSKKYADEVGREFMAITGDRPWHDYKRSWHFDNRISLFHRYGAKAIDAARMLVTTLPRFEWMLRQHRDPALRERFEHYQAWAEAIETVSSRPSSPSTSAAELRKAVVEDYRERMAWHAREKVRKAAEQEAEEAKHRAYLAARDAEKAASVAARKKAADELAAAERLAAEAAALADLARREAAARATRLRPEDLVEGARAGTLGAELRAEAAKRASTLELNPRAGGFRYPAIPGGALYLNPSDAFGIPAGAHLVPVRGTSMPKPGRQLRGPGDIHKFMEDAYKSPVERLYVIVVDRSQRVLGVVIASQGSATESAVHPREVFAAAIEARGAAVILVHNHPSGSARASDADIEATLRLIRVGRIVGIEVLDHVVIGDKDYTSIRAEHGDLWDRAGSGS